ncbi:tRNA uridine-5-carboxymethylaminomethyl(34) synthesis GTPase MnmE [Parvularcula oceani]|uniref:tRNA uridine-5-carboxymethylaminomethyl(34) synthesis GTPase MnmE n=1 Tax=Parvularcula oceani TaxID=1247963 RepID=UPI0004E0BD72|nr:tRNA uridine-5-carboxymethylaminomethyl(34) synthesis GTPase MnmE [Parvularcula oceani]
MFDARATIFAKSSGSGRAGVSVFRISGPRAGEALEAFCGKRGEPRKAHLRSIRLQDGSLLDQGLTLWFPGPDSFTGEDVAELQLHGSPAVERALMDALVAFGLQPAAAGEFTMRAFEAGKLDLTQAEALADLLDAETEAQRRQALGQLGGRLSERAGEWRRLLLTALAAIEAGVDFPDEEDVPAAIETAAIQPLIEMLADMRQALGKAAGARTVREGLTVAISGPPNVGKSSLLNRIAGEERAIVSDRAGTTRDVLEIRADIGGQLVTLLDTAGLREDTEDEIEREGMRRARRAVAQADIRILVWDGEGQMPERGSADLLLLNKADLRNGGPPEGWTGLSVRTGEGWENFLMRLRNLVLRSAGIGDLTRERHVALVEYVVRELEPALSGHLPPELLGEEIRVVLRKLDELTGQLAPDEVLGEIFSSFCIGK